MMMLPRRQVLAGLTLAPLLPDMAAAAIVKDPLLTTAIVNLGIAPDRIDWAGPIRLSAPLTADDGSAVPIGIDVTASAFSVNQIHVFAPGNRRALLTTISPLDNAASPRFQLRIRLAKSQTITALARLSDGRVIAASGEIRVTAGGGCKP